MYPFQTTLLALFFIITSLPNLHAQAIKCMTYNIRFDNPKDTPNAWDDRKEDVKKLISYYNPAILGTQEGLKHQLDYLQDQLPNYTYVGVGRDDGKNKGEYTAIFYDTIQVDLIEQNTFWLSETPEKVSVGWDAAMERICTYGLFKTKMEGIRFWVFNVHFDHVGKQARANATELILKKIESLTGKNDPVVLMGDFNLEPETAPIQSINKVLKDAYSHSLKPSYGPVGTFNAFNPMHPLDRRIDYIFTNQRFLVGNHRHIDDRRSQNLYPSDHLPVFASLIKLGKD